MAVTLSSIARSPAPFIPAARDDSARASQPAAGSPGATDKVTLGANAAPDATYADPRGNAAAGVDVSAMLEESKRQTREILDLLLPLLEQQGLSMAKVISGEQTLSADPETIAEAKAAIADDGEYGVQQVAARILTFAQAAIGGDPSKLASIRAAVEKGFAEATKILGGALPEISQKTYAVVMAEFDRWADQGVEAKSA
ncbi:MAG: hypothetical protein WA924_10615 [Burkholderiaceae bacterium]